MIEDTLLNKLEKRLSDYIKEIDYKISTKPYSTNMELDKNRNLIYLSEYQVLATAINKNGMTVSLSIIPSKNAIFIENQLVKNLD